MRFVYFTHSLVSDWNHGNAHFLRGVVRELHARGHETRLFEPENGWSRTNLVSAHGEAAIARFARRFPGMSSSTYGRADFDLDAMLDGADVVIVHEWNEPWLVAAIGRYRRRGGPFLLLFHDTHHRAATAPDELASFDLDGYDGVLAFGEIISGIYRERGWAREVWTWHEAADTALFRPHPEIEPAADLIWVGNWGDGERTAELDAFLLEPARRLKLSACVHGVRYPAEALAALASANIAYGGWLANDRVPEAFAAHRLTVHVPRGPYARALPGIPTIRMFEALACGIPLVSAPWDDCDGLFRPGRDFLFASDSSVMTRALRELLADPAAAAALAANGLETVRSRHTCAHRVDELLAICAARGRVAAAGDVASEGPRTQSSGLQLDLCDNDGSGRPARRGVARPRTRGVRGAAGSHFEKRRMMSGATDIGQGGNNHFLSSGAAYASSRPTYPASLADALADRCQRTEHALDVGCGSGQLSISLVERFERVTATDPSKGQLESAAPHPRVTYRAEPAERIDLPDDSVDMLTAAQAAHWFDLDAFYDEVRRVARPEAVLALVSYGIPTIAGAVGERLHRFYWQDIHAFWPEGRRHVEEGYRTLAFPFREEALPDLRITREWSLGQLVAYVWTWSAAQRALAAGEGGIVDAFVTDVEPLWGNPEMPMTVTWPVVGRLAPINK